jgi:hypothetical protein
MTRPYFVVFTNDREEDLNFNLDQQFWVVRVRHAENAKDARHKAWKLIHGNKKYRWLVRNGWYAWNTGPVEEEWPPGIRRSGGYYA